jgi:hypothetical protein
VSNGSFSIRPLLGDARDKLHREEITFKVADCAACRLCVYQTAMKVDGVEQATVDKNGSRLIVWLDPAKRDLAPLREAMTKARIDLPKDSAASGDAK